MFRATRHSANAARRYAHVQVRPVAGSLGAEIGGVDLRRLDDAIFAEIYQAWLDHGVIFFRDQELSIEEFEAFTLRFGPFGDNPYVVGLEDHPNVVRVLKEADEPSPIVFGAAWHSDWSFLPAPPKATLLYALDVPDYGGDTLFASSARAWEALSPTYRALLQGLQGTHNAGRGYGDRTRTFVDNVKHMKILTSPDAYRDHPHPVVMRHPETGRPCLFVNPGYTTGILGMTEEESQPILQYLFAHGTHPAFCCRFRWSRGAMAVWDNRCVWHNPISDYHGARRELLRTTVAGEVPVAWQEPVDQAAD